MAREYVIRCEHTAGSVWTPVGLYAIDGEDPRVTRCGMCAHYEEGEVSGCALLDFATEGMAASGFCAWGEERED